MSLSARSHQCPQPPSWAVMKTKWEMCINYKEKGIWKDLIFFQKAKSKKHNSLFPIAEDETSRFQSYIHDLGRSAWTDRLPQEAWSWGRLFLVWGQLPSGLQRSISVTGSRRAVAGCNSGCLAETKAKNYNSSHLMWSNFAIEREQSAWSNYVFIIIPKLLCHKSHFPSRGMLVRAAHHSISWLLQPGRGSSKPVAH